MIETREPEVLTLHPPAIATRHRYRYSTPETVILVGVAGLCSGVVAGWAVEFPVGAVLTPLLAVLYGMLAGEVARRAGRRSLSAASQTLAALMLLIGALSSRIAVAFCVLAKAPDLQPPYGAFYVFADMFSPSPLPAIALTAVLAGAIWRAGRK